MQSDRALFSLLQGFAHNIDALYDRAQVLEGEVTKDATRGLQEPDPALDVAPEFRYIIAAWLEKRAVGRT